MKEIVNKWRITFINLDEDTSINNITEDEHKLYMSDEIHQTRADYREWITPYFEKVLKTIKK